VGFHILVFKKPPSQNGTVKPKRPFMKNVKIGKAKNPDKMRTKEISNRKVAHVGRENKGLLRILSERSLAGVAGQIPNLKGHFGGQSHVSDSNQQNSGRVFFHFLYASYRRRRDTSAGGGRNYRQMGIQNEFWRA
jgi:hypothetical protein